MRSQQYSRHLRKLYHITTSASKQLQLKSLDRSVAVTQWNNMFDRGKALNPPVFAVFSSIFAYLSYRSYNRDQANWIQYAGAAVLMPSAIPFTLLVMNPTNNALISLLGKEIAAEPTRDLLRRWGVLNACRSIFLFASAGLAAWASLTEV